ncbi:MAG: tripartite tricarboxylate transporter substrate binding protein [Burkholderiaceae bacterium]|jgi:tripartite-type tricarboxylate transporter receptor subunit TctC|nr:tripartite tricarboxylate transporter substrate binding protein [Burkholderiaceae bacterium]
MPFKISSQVLRRTALGALVAAAGLLSLTQAQAQAYPSKPVKIVVNFPPGGAADVLARLLSAPLQDALGQPVVVENRGGAGGNIGADAVAKAPGDGYTLLMSSGGTLSINPHLYARMPFDPNKDLVPVAAVARVAVYLVTRPELPAKNVSEFVAQLKANPGKLTFGSPGTGSSPHLAGEMLKSMTGTFAVHVPYRGGGPALQDLLGGQFDFWFDPGVGLQHVRSGRLKLLAVGSSKRSPLFPDVPTLSEAGLKGFDADSYFGLYAPAGTPAEVVTRINTEVNKILAGNAVRERIVGIGGEAAPMAPSAFGSVVAADSKRYGELIRSRNIKPD